MEEKPWWRQLLDRVVPTDQPAGEAVGGIILAVVGLFVLCVAALLVRALGRRLFGRHPPAPVDWDRELREDLATYVVPVLPPGGHRLHVYHVPVRLRLVVVAPAGTEGDVDATAVEKLLDQVVPGLGALAREERPRIRVWPPQLSQQGFALAFQRRTLRPEPAGEPSSWILVAGRAQVGRQPVLVGLGLWAEEPNTIGLLTLGPHNWLDVLRLKRGEG